MVLRKFEMAKYLNTQFKPIHLQNINEIHKQFWNNSLFSNINSFKTLACFKKICIVTSQSRPQWLPGKWPSINWLWQNIKAKIHHKQSKGNFCFKC